MLKTQNTDVMKWLFAFAFVVAFLVVFGGAVRLTRSGLSIVEWNPISGVMPPIGHQAWQEEFAKYQQTPEYQKINKGMTLQEYEFIFYMEWIHRIIARLAGLFRWLPRSPRISPRRFKPAKSFSRSLRSSAAKVAASPTTPAAAARMRANWTKRWRKQRPCLVDPARGHSCPQQFKSARVAGENSTPGP